MECTVHRLVADVALVAESRVLFVRDRDTSGYDDEDGWFLPDDYLAHLEHPDAAARRIVSEQAAGVATEPRLAEIESFDGGHWHLVFHYVAAVESAAPIEATGNVTAAEWFPLGALPPVDQVAHHGWGLETLGRVLGPTGSLSSV